MHVLIRVPYLGPDQTYTDTDDREWTETTPDWWWIGRERPFSSSASFVLFSGAFNIYKLTRAVQQGLNLKLETSRIGRDGNYVTQWAAQKEDCLVGLAWSSSITMMIILNMPIGSAPFVCFVSQLQKYYGILIQ